MSGALKSTLEAATSECEAIVAVRRTRPTVHSVTPPGHALTVASPSHLSRPRHGLGRGDPEPLRVPCISIKNG